MSAVESEAAGDVQQLVTQAFRFGFDEVIARQQCLGPDEQAVSEHHRFDPDFVHSEVLERWPGPAVVFVVADAVLNAGAFAVAAFQDSGVAAGLGASGRTFNPYCLNAT